MEKSLIPELQKKYWKTEPVADLKEMLYRSAEKFKKNYAFRLKDENGKIYGVTYEKFANDVISLGTILIDMGLVGNKIGVIGKNSYNWAVSYLASTIIGIVVPIDKELTPDDVINFLNVAEAGAIIGDSLYIKKILGEKDKIQNKDMKFIKMDNKEKVENVINFNNIIKDGEALLKQGDTRFRDIKIDPNELKVLLFTSGTTGKAKGVSLSHKNITTNIRSIYGIFKVRESDQLLSILPIHHTYECTLGYLLPIYSGCCISYCEGLRYITKNIQEFKPTVILCVPLLLENVHKKITKTIEKLLTKLKRPTDDCSLRSLSPIVRWVVKAGIKKSLGGKMRTFIVGAAAMNPDLVAEFNELGVPALQGYGLTECSPLVAGNNDFYQNNAAVGLPIPNVEYKIENPDENGIGEIIVKGDNVMLGYYKAPEETEKAIVDGWFHTGDLGRIDEQGFLYITGRCKTVIVTKNGKNIYPEEIEYHLNESPIVQEAMVLGVNYENDDETYVNAQIYPDKEYLQEKFGKTELTKEEIEKEVAQLISDVNKKLPNYKHIKKFHIRESEFEKTTTQKIKRFGDNMIIR